MNASRWLRIAALIACACGGKIAPLSEPELAAPADGEATPAASSGVAPACDALGDAHDLPPPADPWGEPSQVSIEGFAVDDGVVYFSVYRAFTSAGDQATGIYRQSIDDPTTPPVAIVPEQRGDGVALQFPWIGVSGSDLYYTVGSPDRLFVRDLDTGDTQPLDATGFEDDDIFAVVPGGLVWSTGDAATWSIDFFDAATRATSVLASGPGGPYPHRLRIAGETIYFTFGDAFEALPLAGGSPRVVRRVDPASVLWLGTAWLLGADERGIYVCDYWAKKPSGPVACSLTLTAPDGSPLGYLVDPAAGFQKYLYDADVFATDDRYAYWTQLDDGAGPDDPQPANALVRVPKTGGTPCVVDARTTRQFAVDETRITYATSGGISMRRKLL